MTPWVARLVVATLLAAPSAADGVAMAPPAHAGPESKAALP